LLDEINYSCIVSALNLEAARAPISACVVAYNRADIIGTVLAGLDFADELIVIDKSSTDATAAIAKRLADRVIRVPWSPTVEETRAFAVEQCSHDWIMLFDDDECLNVEAIHFIDTELRAPRADLYRFPLRHYILGRHDERAFYWPEQHMRLFRRGSVKFLPTVHAGMEYQSDRFFDVPIETGACIHHFSHVDATQWIEKTNRYTSRLDRAKPEIGEGGMIAFAHAAIDQWAQRTRNTSKDGYLEAVTLLRAAYDIVDRVKMWEQEQSKEGAELFAAHCRQLEVEYNERVGSMIKKNRRGRIKRKMAGLFSWIAKR
jgi:glycosyltransferase involved in cell wall biosynthesis